MTEVRHRPNSALQRERTSIWMACPDMIYSIGVSLLSLLRRFIVLTAFTTSLVASAVCLDPKTWHSGYHVPLNEEVQSSQFIATGKVTREKVINDDSRDPGGIS